MAASSTETLLRGFRNFIDGIFIQGSSSCGIPLGGTIIKQPFATGGARF